MSAKGALRDGLQATDVAVTVEATSENSQTEGQPLDDGDAVRSQRAATEMLFGYGPGAPPSSSSSGCW
jgi:hypothetical protein